jgi:hypothetical protein
MFRNSKHAVIYTCIICSDAFDDPLGQILSVYGRLQLPNSQAVWDPRRRLNPIRLLNPGDSTILNAEFVSIMKDTKSLRYFLLKDSPGGRCPLVAFVASNAHEPIL